MRVSSSRLYASARVAQAYGFGAELCPPSGFNRACQTGTTRIPRDRVRPPTTTGIATKAAVCSYSTRQYGPLRRAALQCKK